MSPIGKAGSIEGEIDIVDMMYNAILSSVSEAMKTYEHQVEDQLAEHSIEVERAIHEQVETTSVTQAEVELLKDQIRILEGRLTRAEKEIDDLTEQAY